MEAADNKPSKKKKNRYVFIRLVLIILILIIGGLIYGLAGPENEWGTINIVGVIIFAILFPWEWLFFDKLKKYTKSKK
jgi:membrane protease YdiL (CAAX protease family)